MAVYTVHEPPPRRRQERRGPEHFALVRDGFHFWAFLVPPLWMLWRRLWLALLGFVALTAAVQYALHAFGAPDRVRFWTQFLLAVLVGLEAGTLRRWTLRRRGWREAGIVSGDRLETAERRFFAAWTQQAQSAPAVPPSVASSARYAPPPQSEIVGLFPAPGTPR
jgi:hypothetical protein